ncbi:MAG TPA: four-carbon acid sugar kinase family protein, partial [Opitutaceae bacterium]|nr:four-carbon acid sugar kinase family protein [Opitutaceae bacterium]
MNEPRLTLSQSLDRLPPPWPDDSLSDIVRANAQPGAPKVVVLDDDPTGTQTVRDLPVLTTWGVPELAEELASAHPGFYLLTNSRSLSRVDTVALHRQIATHLLAAAAGRPFTIVSRGDSTLRGHYPAETDALAGVLGHRDLTVIAPFFEAGRRLTLEGIHYLADGDTLIPVAETPFARDPVFGYARSSLPEWIEEKTAGAVTSSQVHCLPLARLRQGGPASAADWLRRLPQGAVCVANAVCTADIEVFAAAAVAAELAGRRILYRTA